MLTLAAVTGPDVVAAALPGAAELRTVTQLPTVAAVAAAVTVRLTMVVGVQLTAT
jgi:hypothetical protein